MLATETLGATGGSVRAALGPSGSVQVSVPPGTIQGDEQVVLTTGNDVISPSTGQVVVDCGVSLVNPVTGDKYTGALSPPITVTITDPRISAGDEVLLIVAPGEAEPYPSADVSDGTVVLTFASDPNFVVVSPGQIMSATAAPTTTTSTTVAPTTTTSTTAKNAPVASRSFGRQAGPKVGSNSSSAAPIAIGVAVPGLALVAGWRVVTRRRRART